MSSFPRLILAPTSYDSGEIRPDFGLFSTKQRWSLPFLIFLKENWIERQFVLPLVVRLQERKSHRAGLVEVYHNKTWGWVCADQWDKLDADVVCRMMEFDGSLSVAFPTEAGEKEAWNLACID